MGKEELKAYDIIDWEKEAVEGYINLSVLASRYSGKVNAVSQRHMYVTQGIFPELTGSLEYVTNGVYHKRWIHPELQEVLVLSLIILIASKILLIISLPMPSFGWALPAKTI